MRTGHHVARLSGDGQRVDGVVLDDGQVITAKRGVVIATGGYDWNVELARGLEGLPDLVRMGPESLTGDGLALGAEVGANIHRIHGEMPPAEAASWRMTKKLKQNDTTHS
jgi:succinate dehydrogenase/fumarate reductase flavoprotein subunit